MNPFNPLITIEEFRAVTGATEHDPVINGFLFRASQILMEYGLPSNMSGEPETVVDELKTTQINRGLVVALNQPVLNLTSIKLKDSTSSPVTYNIDIPISDFRYAKYYKYIETQNYNVFGLACNDLYESGYYKSSQTIIGLDSLEPLTYDDQIIQVTYTTGLEDTDQVKADILKALAFMYHDLGTRFVQMGLNENLLVSKKVDDTWWQYSDNPNFVRTPANYVNTNKYLDSILSKYRGIEYPIF